MMGNMNAYFELTKRYPNKYKLTPKSIRQLKILDWDRLKEETWYNQAKERTGHWWCHLEGCNLPDCKYDDENEFWIGFREEDDKIDCHWTSYGGMCGYKFSKFYQIDDIENRYDLMVQVNTIKWLNQLIDRDIIGVN